MFNRGKSDLAWPTRFQRYPTPPGAPMVERPKTAKKSKDNQCCSCGGPCSCLCHGKGKGGAGGDDDGGGPDGGASRKLRRRQRKTRRDQRPIYSDQVGDSSAGDDGSFDPDLAQQQPIGPCQRSKGMFFPAQTVGLWRLIL